ncbi:CAP domain-containing protein [Demequina lignilytica]|uniref:CAP domain-containing protein n=1 Tax=Demequina lignilytica TaxID=3051663 RepID=A0AB35MF52_9MICO|nr:CAP domain-containing protein [Demequina sp. SYSU T0a273]MDN4482393.1 CAP domain-containing protein [Demequina sp. SYSU T0a273]
MQHTFRTRSTRLLAAFGALALAATIPVATAPAAQAATAYSLSSSTLLLELTNDYRSSKGLSALRWNTGAASVAQTWSEKMLAEGRMYHNPNVFSQIPSGWTGAAENVGYACGYSSAAAAAKAIMSAWKKSAGHDKNLRGSYTDIGIGFAWNSSTRCGYATQDFAKYSGTPSTQTIFGTITPPSGDSMSTLSSAVVVATGTGGTRKASVDPTTGAYMLTGVPRGTYTVQVQTSAATNEYLTDAATSSCASRLTVKSDRFNVDVELTDGTLTSPSSRVVLCDVSTNQDSVYYKSNAPAIAWLIDSGYTNGYDNGYGGIEYRHTLTINRAYLAALLYRLAGRPEFTPPATSPYTDIDTNHKFYKEITWLEAEGVYGGYKLADGTAEFRAYALMNRAYLAALMYRLAGKPSYTPPKTSPYADITPSSKFYKEICWLRAEGIDDGFRVASGAEEYRPATEFARFHMATLFYGYVKAFG